MPNKTEIVKTLAAELNSQAAIEITPWLHKALEGAEWRLPVDRGESPDLGLARIKPYLKGDTREAIRASLLTILKEWCARLQFNSPIWSDEKLDALFSTIVEFASTSELEESSSAAFAILWNFINDPLRFDSLSGYFQIRIQNILEERSELFSTTAWRALFVRDPARFGPTVFGALIRLSLHEGLAILPDLPGTEIVVEALRLRVRWILTLLPTEDRQGAFRQIAQTLQQTSPAIRDVMRNTFLQCGAPLPEALSPRFPGVLDALNAEPLARDALNPFEVITFQ